MKTRDADNYLQICIERLGGFDRRKIRLDLLYFNPHYMVSDEDFGQNLNSLVPNPYDPRGDGFTRGVA